MNLLNSSSLVLLIYYEDIDAIGFESQVNDLRFLSQLEIAYIGSHKLQVEPVFNLPSPSIPGELVVYIDEEYLGNKPLLNDRYVDQKKIPRSPDSSAKKLQAILNTGYSDIEQYIVQNRRNERAGFDLTTFEKSGFERLREKHELGKVEFVARAKSTWADGTPLFERHSIMTLDCLVKMTLSHNPLTRGDGHAGYIGIAGTSRITVDETVDTVINEATYVKKVDRNASSFVAI